MKCNYLVTGGLGFIGNELVRQLKPFGSVVILDNRNRTAPHIADLRDVPVEVVDVTDAEKVSASFRKYQPDVVFHLAAIHYIPECNANPERTLRTNVEATLALLRASSAAHVKHFLLASSGAVYADSPEPLRETSPVVPVDIYGWSKLQAEQLCGWHSQSEGLPVTACRLFNNYGPRETNAHIIPEIIGQLRSGDTLRLGNITTRRDYIYTADTARALKRLADNVPPAGVMRTVNVSSGEHASVEEIIALIGDLLDRRLEVLTDLKRFRKADKQIQVGDISLLKSLTGWNKQVNLCDGMRSLLEFEGLIQPAHLPTVASVCS